MRTILAALFFLLDKSQQNQEPEPKQIADNYADLLNNLKLQIKLSDRQKLILQFLGASSRKYYFLS